VRAWRGCKKSSYHSTLCRNHPDRVERVTTTSTPSSLQSVQHSERNIPSSTLATYTSTMVLTRARGRLALTQTAARSFRILDLPPELVTQTFELLAASDPCSILSARFTCRAFRDHSIVAFGKNFFDHLVAMLHPISLTVLLEIATHEQLSKFVQKVTISGERIGARLSNREM
jgi:hypothetical protein